MGGYGLREPAERGKGKGTETKRKGPNGLQFYPLQNWTKGGNDRRPQVLYPRGCYRLGAEGEKGATVSARGEESGSSGISVWWA